jgi:hypothetical protein
MLDSLNYHLYMDTDYIIVRNLENGEKLFIAALKKRRQAQQLLQSFSENWPATYELQECDHVPGGFSALCHPDSDSIVYLK